MSEQTDTTDLSRRLMHLAAQLVLEGHIDRGGDAETLLYEAAKTLSSDTPFVELAHAAAQERDRQTSAEGWDAEHDSMHKRGELVRAAACYLRASLHPDAAQEMPVPPSWPWDLEWWKPTTAHRNLEKALALTLAEEARLIQMTTILDPSDSVVKAAATAAESEAA